MPSRPDRHPEIQPATRSARQARDLERSSVIRHSIERVLQDLERRFDNPSDPA